jgi:hypothetical protein
MDALSTGAAVDRHQSAIIDPGKDTTMQYRLLIHHEE